MGQNDSNWIGYSDLKWAGFSVEYDVNAPSGDPAAWRHRPRGESGWRVGTPPNQAARKGDGYLPGTGPLRFDGPAFDQTPEEELRAALGILLDSVDYERGACRVNELVGAVLPADVLSLARTALNRGRG